MTTGFEVIIMSFYGKSYHAIPRYIYLSYQGIHITYILPQGPDPGRHSGHLRRLGVGEHHSQTGQLCKLLFERVDLVVKV